MTETPKMALVPHKPNDVMVDQGLGECPVEPDHDDIAWVYSVMLANAAHSGRVSREDLERAARALYENAPYARRRDGRLHRTWTYMSETFPENAVMYREWVAAALRALGLEVGDE